MNTPRNIWVIPDIHARFDLLAKLWMQLQGEIDLTQDRVIYLGDMIDRGFQADKVLRFIRQQVKHSTNVIALKGNHEDFLLDCYRLNSEPQDWELWFYDNNGGKTTHASLMAIEAEERMNLVDWVRQLPTSHKEEGFFFSHAPVPRENRRSLLLRDQPFSDRELLQSYPENRDEPGFARDFGDGIIGVCGHVHKLRDGVREPRFYPHYIYADAGCGCHPKAPLVAIEVRSRRTISVTEDT